MREKLEFLLEELQNNASDSVFSEIYLLLSALNSHDLPELLGSLKLAKKDVIHLMLTHLRSANEDGIRCLQKVMESLNATDIITLDDTLILGLTHPSEDVQGAFLKALKLCIEDNKAVVTFLQNIPLLNIIAKLISDDSASVAKHSSNLIVFLCNHRELGNSFLTSLKSAFCELLNGTDTVKLRFYQLIVSIASVSPSSLQAVAEDYLEKLILESQKSEDFLIQLNCIELLTELAGCSHGLMFLVQRGVLQQFQQYMQDCTSNPLSSFLLPGLLRFFGNIGIANPDEISTALPFLLSIVKTSDSSLQGIAIETLGAVGTSNNGKKLLFKYNSEMEDCMQLIGRVIASGESEQRVRAIYALVRIFTVEENSRSNEVESIVENWYKCIGENRTGMFVVLCKQPFLELKLGALDVLGTLAFTFWGQTELVSQPGLMEYLLDRSTEKEKEGKEKKYGIVQAIVRSATASEIFSSDILAKLKKFEKEGPFFLEPESAVDFERFE